MHERGVWTLVRRECLRLLNSWKSAIIPPLVTNALYIVVFGAIVGSRVDKIQGFAYIDFILPGLIGLVAVTNAFNASSFSIFHARWDDYVSEVLTSSLTHWEMLLGYLSGSLFLGLVTSAGITVIALAFTTVSFLHFGVFLVFLILSCILFGCLGVITGLACREFGELHMVSNFVIMPLAFLGGVFFSLEMIAPGWHWLVKLNPLLYVVNGLRYGMSGFSDVGTGFAVFILTGCCVVAVAGTLYLIRSGFGLRK